MKRAPSQNVLIVDEDRMTRMQLCTCLRHTRHFRLGGEAADLPAAQRPIRTHTPGFIVVELPFRGMAGPAVLAQMHQWAPHAQIVVISACDEYAAQSLAFGSGARAYIHRSDAPEAVAAALDALAHGQLYASAHAAYRQLEHLAAPARAAHVLDGVHLSDRELEVFIALGRGCRRSTIALLLGISPKTIEIHQARLKRKLGLSTAAELYERARAYVAELDGKDGH